MELVAKRGFRASVAKAGYSLRSLAEETGLARESVCRAANGRPVRAGTAKKICATLGVEFDDLFLVVEDHDGEVNAKQ